MPVDGGAAVLPRSLARRFEAVVLVGEPIPDEDSGAEDLLRCAGPSPEALPLLLAGLWQEGLHPSDVLVVDDGTGSGQRARQVWRLAQPCVVGCVGGEAPPRVAPLPAGTDVRTLLADQVGRRRQGELPHPPEDPAWTLRVDGLDPERERVWEALLALGDGRVGLTGAPLASHPSAQPTTLAAGVYDGEGPTTRLLNAPVPLQLPFTLPATPALSRVLDLRTGVLHERGTTTRGELAAARFPCLARPGTVVLRAACPDQVPAEPPVATDTAALTTAVADVRHASESRPHVVDRVVAHVTHEDTPSPPDGAVAVAREASSIGFDGLLDEQRRAWATRWGTADITIEREPQLQHATRLMLFHLMGSVADRGEAAVGARGLTGHGYSGHVFWDADTFVLPFLAATHPAAARAMLEYRVRRLPRALAAAQALGRAGARFPWESAATGDDVTPTTAYNRAGRLIDVRTGQYEEHIVAEVAWAASTYVEWTGDLGFAAGPGLRLLTETARWWAARVERDADGSGHLRGVIGPDEYHEDVDDNAFTNGMARWNLRRAADAVDAATPGSTDVTPDEARRWREIAAAVVDCYDATTGRHEQFAGFSDLEPLIIAEVAPRRPIAADVLMGRDRVQATQVVKQPDVLMLHHLVPDEVPAGSLLRDLDFYEPRTAHGSSLSPGIHAALLARAGRTARALDALQITARIDLDDLTGTTAAGIHLATAGALWQALVWGFAGVRPRLDRLVVEPRVPSAWGRLDIRLAYRGSRVRVRCVEQEAEVVADPPVPVLVHGRPALATPHGLRPDRPPSPRRAP